MELKSLQFNEVEWRVFQLSEYAILISPVGVVDPLREVHKAMAAFNSLKDARVSEFIPAFDSITILFNSWKDATIHTLEDLFAQLSTINVTALASQKHIVKVCYELGLDWAEVEAHTGLTKENIIQQHSGTEYTIAMMGFLPGFIFLDGLDEALHCPRKESPRVCLPAGSVGIGGAQTGLYSLQSPGGWQIIGRSPESFFNANENPPTTLNAGDTLIFQPITESEYQKLSAHG